jgi:hypothetical protein
MAVVAIGTAAAVERNRKESAFAVDAAAAKAVKP